METVTLNKIYKHIKKIERRLDKMEDILQIPEEELPEGELKEHLETVRVMKEGKEGTSWEEYKTQKAGSS